MGLSQDQLNAALARGQSATDAYENAKKRQLTESEGAAGRDAALAQLIKGKELNQQAVAENFEASQQAARDAGLDPRQTAISASVGGRGYNPEVDPIKLLLAKSSLEKPKQTVGQESADRTYGKEYADFIANGGSKVAEKNLGLLEGVQKELKAKGNRRPGLLARAVQYLPEGARTALTPDVKAQEDKVRTAVQGTLKQVLGAQFTAAEGEGIMKRSYDPRLSAKQNLEKMKPEIDALKAKLDAQMKSARRFEETGSISNPIAPGQQSGKFDHLTDEQLMELYRNNGGQ